MKKSKTFLALFIAPAMMVALTASALAEAPKGSTTAVSPEAFIELCKTGTVQEIQEAIKAGADVNARDNDGWTALKFAAWRADDPGIVSALTKAGADVNAKNNNGVTALMNAAAVNENPGVVSALMNAGADVNARDNDGETAVMAAGRGGTPEVVSLLIQAGADVNAKDNYGVTALMNAAQFNKNPEVVSVLIKAGADVNAKNNGGETALDLARAENKNPEVISLLIKAVRSGASESPDTTLTVEEFLTLCQLGTPQMIQEALDIGADANAGNDIGITPLMYAAGRANTPETIAILVKAGADVNARTYNDGVTALMFAALYNRNPEVFSTLAKAGADVNARDNDGWTALTIAVRYNRSPRVVSALLNAGATDNGDRKVMDLARERGNEEIVSILEKAGFGNGELRIEN